MAEDNQKNKNDIILNYRILVESSIYWEKKIEILTLIDNFVDNKVNGEKFEDKYYDILNEISRKSENYTNLIENDSIDSATNLEIYFTSKQKLFSSLSLLNLPSLLDLYSSTISDSESSNFIYSENKLREIIKTDIIPKLQEFRN